MLEEKWSYAEQIVKKQSIFREGENINYIDPDNDIEKGYIIINYRKRDLERILLQNHCVSMVLPTDWQYADMEETRTFFYFCPYEKEVLILQEAKDSQTSLTEIFKEIITEIQERSGAEPGRKGVETGNNEIQIPYFDWTENDMYYFSFFMQEHEQILNGIFRVHIYREKAWQKIFPQLLRTIHMEGHCHE